jgi:hypothetical protein
LKTFLSLSGVKVGGDYTYLESGAPTNLDRAPLYANGDTWLDLITGYSYVLTDDTVGTWSRYDQGNDTKMTMLLDTIFMNVIKDICNIFPVDRNKKYLNNMDGYYDDFPFGMPNEFTRKEAYNLLVYESLYSKWTFEQVDTDTYTITGEANNVYGNMSESLQAGDTIYVKGSRRNDGYFTVVAVDALFNMITVQEPVISEVSNAFIFLCAVPDEVIKIAERMVYFDVMIRPKQAGMKSESIGTYSYTRGDSGNSLNYPDDIIAGLDAYRLTSIGGQSLFVS